MRTSLLADLRAVEGGGDDVDVNGLIKLFPHNANICGCLLNWVVNAPCRPAMLRVFIERAKIAVPM